MCFTIVFKSVSEKICLIYLNHYWKHGWPSVLFLILFNNYLYIYIWKIYTALNHYWKHRMHLVLFFFILLVVFCEYSLVVDPGFSWGGANSQSGCANLLLWIFLPKSAWKWKNLDLGTRVPSVPLPLWIRQCSRYCWLVRGSLFIELGCPRDLGKGWRGDLGTFMISRPI